MSSNTAPLINESQIKDIERFSFLLTKTIDRAKRCCFNCASFNEAQLYCIVHKGNPPPRIVCFGCDSFMPSDDIPY